MKLVLLFALGLVALASALPKDIVDFELDDHEQEQKGDPGRAVEGKYSWTAPDGQEIYIKYRADRNGFQVLDDNVLPEVVEAEDAEEDDEN